MIRLIRTSLIAAVLAGSFPPQGLRAASVAEMQLYLCGALEAAGSGDQIPVELSGMILTSFEQRVFFDPDQPQCRWDVQPSTWVEIAPDSPGRENLDLALEETGGALVTVRGQLYGPPVLGPDDPSLPPPAAYANRVGGRRYGHHGAFRTKLLIDEVLTATPAPQEVASRPIIHRPRTQELAVHDATLPQYPELARRAGIMGEVSVELVVKAGKVFSAEALSGDRLLAAQAVSDVQSWEFSDDLDASFATLFVYRLETRPAGTSLAPRLELQLPWLVRITSPREGW